MSDRRSYDEKHNTSTIHLNTNSKIIYYISTDQCGSFEIKNGLFLGVSKKEKNELYKGLQRGHSYNFKARGLFGTKAITDYEPVENGK